jgi:hypothetical protein
MQLRDIIIFSIIKKIVILLLRKWHIKSFKGFFCKKNLRVGKKINRKNKLFLKSCI